MSFKVQSEYFVARKRKELHLPKTVMQNGHKYLYTVASDYWQKDPIFLTLKRCYSNVVFFENQMRSGTIGFSVRHVKSQDMTKLSPFAYSMLHWFQRP